MPKKQFLKTPKISVIVTTFNRKAFLKETLDSILQQTYADFELIVVDNNSDYDFLAFMAEYDDLRIRSYQNQNDGIIAKNRNYGIQKANGEFLAFCDDDDIWHREKLKKQLNLIEEKNADLVHTNMFIFNKSVSEIINVTKSVQYDSLNKLINESQIYTSSVLVKNKDVCFPENPQLIAVEDYSLWLNLLSKKYKFELCNDKLVYYRINDENNSKKIWALSHVKIIYVLTDLYLKDPKLMNNFIFVRVVIKHLLKFIAKSLLFKKS